MNVKKTYATTKMREWWGWYGAMSWLFLMKWGYDQFMLESATMREEASWAAFFFVALLALSISMISWRYGRNPDVLGRIAFIATPVAIVATAVFPLAPEPFASVLYVLSAALMAPAVARRAYGVLRTADQGSRLTRYMTGILACIATYVICLIVKLPKEAAFIVPALLAVPSWLGVRRTVSVSEHGASAKIFNISKKLVFPIIIAVFLLVCLDVEQGLINAHFLVAWIERSRIIYTALGYVLPPIGFVVFAFVSDKNHDRAGFTCGMCLFLVGILCNYGASGYQAPTMMALFFTNAFFGSYIDFFLLTVAVYLFDRTKLPVFAAVFGIILNLIVSAMGLKAGLWIPEPLRRLNAPIIVSVAVLTVLFIVIGLMLFERYREKNLAAALFSMFHDSKGPQTLKGMPPEAAAMDASSAVPHGAAEGASPGASPASPEAAAQADPGASPTSIETAVHATPGAPPASHETAVQAASGAPPASHETAVQAVPGASPTSIETAAHAIPGASPAPIETAAHAAPSAPQASFETAAHAAPGASPTTIKPRETAPTAMPTTPIPAPAADAKTQGMSDAGLTQDEIKIALLLMEGETRRTIERKLGMKADEVIRHEAAMRKKLNLVRGLDPAMAAAVSKYKLTKRETDMLRYLTQSMSNEEIASELFLSTETVKIHVRNLMRKLPVESRADISTWMETIA